MSVTQAKGNRKRRRWIGASAICFTMAFVCLVARLVLGGHIYDGLLAGAEKAAQDQKLQCYIEAIELSPARKEAYLGLLDCMDQDHALDEEESSLLISICRLYGNRLKHRDAAQIWGQAALQTMREYGEDPIAALEKAYPLLQCFYEADPAGDTSQLCHVYYQIGAFYEKYVWVQTSGQFEQVDVKDHLNCILTACTQIQIDASVGADDRLVFSWLVCELISTQRNVLAANCPKGLVKSVLDSIYNSLPGSEDLDLAHTEDLREELLEHEERYRELLERAYSRTGGAT